MTLYTSISQDTEQLAERCVDVLDALGGQAMEKFGKFIVSLAGGSTPRAIYRAWARNSKLDWNRVMLWFGDERCVPPDHADSNYNMVAENLLGGLPGEPEIIRMEGEHADPEQAARNYDHALRKLFAEGNQIHVALLGIGTDGHTASLFPSMEAVRQSDALCVSTPSPDGGMQRLTLTVPCLRDARKLFFLAAGEGKAAILNRLMEGPLNPEELPAQFFLRDDRMNVNLLLDEAAAARLSRRE
ncbi:MAG: 6-phosphogluconolactonase [bacterium]